VSFSPDGKTLVSDSTDGTMKLWDVTTCEELLTLRGPFKDSAYGARFAPDGRTLAFWAGDENGIELDLLPTALPADLTSEEDP
jgi:WD40 repeat protein